MSLYIIKRNDDRIQYDVYFQRFRFGNENSGHAHTTVPWTEGTLRSRLWNRNRSYTSRANPISFLEYWFLNSPQASLGTRSTAAKLVSSLSLFSSSSDFALRTRSPVVFGRFISALFVGSNNCFRFFRNPYIPSFVQHSLQELKAWDIYHPKKKKKKMDDRDSGPGHDSQKRADVYTVHF